MARFEIRISNDGQRITVQGQEFHGPGCLEKAQTFFKKLGIVESTKLTTEFHETPYNEADNVVWEEF